MSDTQRDREERQHVIEVLQNMVDWMEAANYIVATPERIHALDYAIASIETDLKYDLLYEETSEQADKQANEPRKGEWLRMSDLSEQEDDRYKCSRCGNVIHHKNKMDLYTFNSWCGRCGSDNGRHINYEVEE